MYSKALELAGLTLIAIGIGTLLGSAAGVLTGGVCLLFVGSVTDDAAVGMRLRRGIGWMRYGYHKQVLMETATQANSPHPPIEVDPETEAAAQRAAIQRIRRGDGRIREVIS